VKNQIQIIKSIQSRIYEIRGERIMLDFDLAFLYEVETRVLNQAVKRNIKRFPNDFMFQLKGVEFEIIRNQIDTFNQNMSSQNVMTSQSPSSQFVMMGNLPQNRTNKYLPYAFTEQGVAMLSGVLNSDKAINMNITIMRAFVEIRRIVMNEDNFEKQLQKIKERIGEHDAQLSEIYEAIENLLDENAAKTKWDERQRIGFKK